MSAMYDAFKSAVVHALCIKFLFPLASFLQVVVFERSHITKNTFSLVSTYISWSSLSLPTPRMRKTSDSWVISAAHPLVTRRSYRLFRICPFPYIKEGVIIIGRPSLRCDRRYLRGGRSSPRWSSVCPAVRQQCFTMLSLRVRHTNSSDVSCINKHKCLYSVPATEQQKRQRESLVSFLTTTCRLRFVLTDCFSNEGQDKAGFASTLTLIKGSAPTIPDPATAPEPQVSVAAVW